MSKHYETSGAILVDAAGRFLLQQRDNIPEILYLGKIGLFGGHLEANETSLECIVREIHEETSYFVSAGRFTHLTAYEGPHPCGGTIRCEIYVARDVPADQLRITEGSLVSVAPGEISTIEAKLSPTAHRAVNVFLKDRT
jgi:8-oxo-dGTP pyrophosphatase MutT (NUDIX family)